MADVEESSMSGMGSVHEMKASDETSRSAQRPGSITRRNRNVNSNGQDGSAVLDGCGSSGHGTQWNTFAKDYPKKKPLIQVSDYSKEEGMRRKQREKERRALRERQIQAQQERAEAEAAKQREIQAQQAAEHKARVRARLAAQHEKINRAAEEREKREAAYQQLISKTREKGLLYERLQAEGESKISQIQREMQDEYSNTFGRARKVHAADIAARSELHPSLKVIQRRQREANRRRDTERPPPAFIPKGAASPTGGSSFISSFATHRPMPGTSTFDTLRNETLGRPLAPTTSSATSGTTAPRPRATQRGRSRRPSPTRAAVTVDRASTPVDLPGVEIRVNGELYAAPAQAPSAAAMDGGCAAEAGGPRDGGSAEAAEALAPRSVGSAELSGAAAGGTMDSPGSGVAVPDTGANEPLGSPSVPQEGLADAGDSAEAGQEEADSVRDGDNESVARNSESKEQAAEEAEQSESGDNTGDGADNAAEDEQDAKETADADVEEEEERGEEEEEEDADEQDNE